MNKLATWPSLTPPSVSQRSGLLSIHERLNNCKSRRTCTLGRAIHSHVVVVKTPASFCCLEEKRPGPRGGNERRRYYEWALRCSQ